MTRKIPLFLAGLLLVFGVFSNHAISLYAQETQSTILGSVTDSSGAAIPDAAITVRNEGDRKSVV